MVNKTLTVEKINHLVLTKQHLTKETSSDDLCQITREINGLHATNNTTPYLSLFARSNNFEKSHLDEALYEQKVLAKIRCVRKTIFIHTKEMLPIAYKSTAKMVQKAARSYMEYRGISLNQYEELSRRIMRFLEYNEMTAAAIKKSLDTNVDVSAILYLMCDQGLLIRGRPRKGWKDKNIHYGLFREYFPDIDLASLNESQAIAMLVERYLHAFSPVTEDDIIWWTGLGKTKVRKALERIWHQLIKIKIENIDMEYILHLSDQQRIMNMDFLKDPIINLLPSLDSYIMGYKDRRRYINTTNYNNVFDRSGNATSTILVNGKIVGVWDFEKNEKPLVKLHLFTDIGSATLDEILTNARKIGKFIGDEEANLKVCESMIPLTERPAGSIMTPLKNS